VGAKGKVEEMGRGRGFVSDVNFRAVERQDMVAVIGLIQSISTFEPPVELHDSIWRDFCAQANLFSLVGEHEGIPVGYGAVLIEQKIRGGKVGHIEDIVTHPLHRGMGLGRALVEALSRKAFELGCYKVALHCQPHNVAFYEKCGFVSSGNSMQRFPPSS
jgi:glucosamine-phosphate N-acetyltransferase